MTRPKESGQILIQVIVFGAIAVYFVATLASWAGEHIKVGRQALAREQAIQIAEAGADYYRWHLAHAPQDYQDGTGTSTPHVHDYLDKDGNHVGQFTLTITPPPLGSSLVTIKSVGKVDSDPNISRTIVTQLAKPSIAKYATVANAVLRFGAGTEVFGPIHSNSGIRFDGLAHNIVSSSLANYDDPDHTGANDFAVHTHLAPPDPVPPGAVPSRPDVFESGRQFPVPAVDFAGITSDLAQMKTAAQTSGFYRAGSGGLGYHVVVKVNDTFDLYRVTSLVNPAGGCTNVGGQTDWGTWSIQNQALIGNFAFPTNGLIFLEDHVYVDGQINTARVTIIAALLPDNPASRKQITINTNLRYTNVDGQDVIGLIAQGNLNVGMVSDTTIRIDAALISQNGRVGRYYYGAGCTPYHSRQTLTLWGTIATSQRYGFAYTDGTGYQIRNINYDARLLYSPPPSFPLTSDQYTTLSWEEIR